MKWFRPLVVVLVLSLLLPASVVLATGLTRYEYYLDTNFGQRVYQQYWKAQSFTPSTTHTIALVKLKGYKTGNPGTLTISIQKTTGSPAVPDGTDLSIGTFNANVLTTDGSGEWFEVPMSATILEAGTQYAWAARALDGDTGNRVYLRLKLFPIGAYPGGVQMASTNSGASWFWGEPDGLEDFAFEEWGYEYTPPPPSIVEVILTALPWAAQAINTALVAITAIPHLVAELVSTAKVVVTATPGGFGVAASTFLILVVGGYYTLRRTGVMKSTFGGGDDD